MIDIKNLTMKYGSTIAVDDLSFHVGKGEILGLLGPNGAGKSTTMKILTTFIIPSFGRCSIGGFDVIDDSLEVRNMTGYLPETAPLYVDMTVRDYLDFVGRTRHLSESKLKERLAWVVDACGLKLVFHRVISELSRGYKQRVGLAQALIHDPDVLILDEPTSGLDPLQILGIRDLIKELGKIKTIIFSTHILQEVVAVSDRVIIINEGKVVADGSVNELKQKASKKSKTILSLKAIRAEVENELSKIGKIHSFACRDNRSELTVDGIITFELYSDVEIWEDVDKLVKSKNWMLKSYYKEDISFEEAFIILTREAMQKGVTS